MNRENNILIAGFGSDILTDDGISAKLVKDIESSHLLAECDFVNFLTSTLEMLELFSTYKKLILIDAMKTTINPVGTLKKLTLDKLDYTLHLSNFHDHAFPEMIEIAKNSNLMIPNDIYIYGIEIKEAQFFSSTLSESLEKQYHLLRQEIIKTILTIQGVEEILGETNNKFDLVYENL